MSKQATLGPYWQETANKVAIVAVFCWLMFSLLHLPAAEATDFKPEKQPYQLGRGYTIDALGLTVGGYLNIDYEAVENRTGRLKLDDLSLLIAWKASSRLHFFSELELEELVTMDGSSVHSDNFRFNVERLYADILLNEQTTLRIGKFLTPVGRWNVVHATPLVWTVERPLVTDSIAFSTHSNGLMLHGTVELDNYDLDYNVYVDNSKHLDPQTNQETSFQNALGGHWNLNLSNGLQVGASYVNYQSRFHPSSERFNLFGLDFLWTRKGVELSGELLYRLGEKRGDDEKGLYAQAVVPIWHQFYGVTRYEYYDQASTGNELHLGVAGLAYRPSPPLVFKLEYRFGQDNQYLAPSGLFSSIAVLF